MIKTSIKNRITKSFMMVCIASLTVSAAIMIIVILNMRLIMLNSGDEISEATVRLSANSLMSRTIEDMTKLVSSEATNINANISDAMDKLGIVSSYIEELYANPDDYMPKSIPNYKSVGDGEFSAHWFLQTGSVENERFDQSDLERLGLLDETYKLGNAVPLFEALMQSRADIYSVMLQTKSGININYDDDAYIKAQYPVIPDMRALPWYKMTSATNEAFISEPYEDSAGRGLCVTIGIPVSDSNGEFIAAVALGILVSELQKTVDNMSVSENGYTLLTSSNMLISASDSCVWTRENLPPYLDMLAADESGVMVLPSDNGVNSYVFWDNVSLTGWRLACVMPITDIVAPAEYVRDEISALTLSTVSGANEQIFVLVLVLCGLLCLILTGTLISASSLSRNISEPIRKMTEDASLIGDGALDHVLTVDTGDELEVLSDSFNKMIANVKKLMEEKNALIYLKEILNGIDAMICVTDPETDELLFINDCMREVFNVGVEYSGQVCYRVLRNLDKRCWFCPCDKLVKGPEKEVIWEQSHDLTNRVYRSYSKLIDWPNGRSVHIQHAVDITDLKVVTDTLDRQYKRQALMTQISQSFLTDEDIDVLITDALKSIGEFMGISQALLLKKEDDSYDLVCRNEWINPKYSNLPSRIGSRLPLSEVVQVFLNKMRDEHKMHITSDDPGVHEILLPYRENFEDNYVCMGIYFGDELHAVLDFSRDDNVKFSQGEINTAQLVTNLMTGVYQKRIAEEKLIQAKEYAEQSNRYKSAFLANMSHEIRTPMNAILGITEIQLQNNDLPPQVYEALEKIYESGDLLLNIINDILDLSKIEAGKLEIVPVKYDIPGLVNDTVQLNRLRYEDKPIEFILEVDENTVLNAYGDELRIKQILNNILSNAYKYTEKGEIRMSVTSETDGDDITLIFSVSDTGQGMNEDELKNLFVEFMRFNLDLNRTTVGTGLGLSITKRLVDLMGGEIEVFSRPQEGTVFIVRIKQKRVNGFVCGAKIADRLKKFRFRSSSMSKKSRMTHEYMPYGSVLVVDDVESNIYVTVGMLMPYGLQTDVASSGFEALDKVKSGKVYDVIFMDHMMPRMDGIETTKKLRAMGYTGYIVALTANAIVGQADIFLENGFDGYISKPIDSRELNHTLNDFIRNQKPPEVVEAARREKHKRNSAPVQSLPQAKGEETRKIEQYFIADAQKIIMTLERLNAKQGGITTEDLNLCETIVHGAKSALLNINKADLSNFALKLETAAKNGNLDLLQKETPRLIEALKETVKHIREN